MYMFLKFHPSSSNLSKRVYAANRFYHGEPRSPYTECNGELRFSNGSSHLRRISIDKIKFRFGETMTRSYTFVAFLILSYTVILACFVYFFYAKHRFSATCDTLPLSQCSTSIRFWTLLFFNDERFLSL